MIYKAGDTIQLRGAVGQVIFLAAGWSGIGIRVADGRRVYGTLEQVRPVCKYFGFESYKIDRYLAGVAEEL